MEWFLQLLPVVPRALLHRCLPSKTKKKTFKNAPDWFFLWRSIYINQRYKHRKQIINALYYELIGNKLRIRYLNTYQEFENN